MGTVVNPFAYSLGGGQGVSAGGGGPDGTQYYVEVTIAASEVASTLTDFPVYVDLSDLPAAFFTNVQSDGGDIRVTESDGTTRCPVELVSIDTGASTGELHFLASSLSSSTDTTFRIYYDGGGGLSQPGVATTYGRNAVWSDYQAVWHLSGDPSGSEPTQVDSTGNGYDGTTAGTMTPASGKLGGDTTLTFDGTEYVSTSLDFTTIPEASVSAWSYKTGTSDGVVIGQFDGNYGVRIWHDVGGANQSIAFLAGDGGSRTIIGTDATAYTNSTWVHSTLVFDGPNLDLLGYVNGSLDSSDTSTGEGEIEDPFSGNFAIGVDNTANPNTDMEGRIDEVRVRYSVLSADWIAAEYTNQNTPTTFYTIGSQQAA